MSTCPICGSSKDTFQPTCFFCYCDTQEFYEVSSTDASKRDTLVQASKGMLPWDIPYLVSKDAQGKRWIRFYASKELINELPYEVKRLLCNWCDDEWFFPLNGSAIETVDNFCQLHSR